MIRCATLVVLVVCLAACAGQAQRSQEHYRETAFSVQPSAPVELGEQARDLQEQAAASDATPEAQGQPAPERLDLRRCMRVAIARDQRLRIAGERMLQADLRRRRAIAGVLPQVAVHAQYDRDSEAVEFAGSQFAPVDSFTWYARATQPLFNGRLFPALDLAEHARAIEALELQDQRDRLLFATATAFYEILSLQADVAALESASEQAAEDLRQRRQRLAAGVALPEQVSQAAATLAERRAQLVQLRGDAERARARLQRLTGVPTREVALEPDCQPGWLPATGADDVDAALDARPDLRAAEARLASAGDLVRLRRKAYLPTIDVEFTWWGEREEGPSEDIDWTVSLTGDWTIYDGGARGVDLEQARSDGRIAAFALRDLRREAAYQIIKRKGATNHAIGLVTASPLKWMLRTARRVRTVSGPAGRRSPETAPARLVADRRDPETPAGSSTPTRRAASRPVPMRADVPFPP